MAAILSQPQSVKCLTNDIYIYTYMIYIYGYIEKLWHMNVEASKITGNSLVCSKAYSGLQQRSYQLPVLLAFCEENPLVFGDSPHKGPINQKASHVMASLWSLHIDGLVQDCSNSSALAMELLQSCSKLSTLSFSSAWISFHYLNHKQMSTILQLTGPGPWLKLWKLHFWLYFNCSKESIRLALNTNDDPILWCICIKTI